MNRPPSSDSSPWPRLHTSARTSARQSAPPRHRARVLQARVCDGDASWHTSALGRALGVLARAQALVQPTPIAEESQSVLALSDSINRTGNRCLCDSMPRLCASRCAMDLEMAEPDSDCFRRTTQRPTRTPDAALPDRATPEGGRDRPAGVSCCSRDQTSSFMDCY